MAPPPPSIEEEPQQQQHETSAVSDNNTRSSAVSKVFARLPSLPNASTSINNTSTCLGRLSNPFVDACLLDRYNAHLESNPVLTKALTAATVQGLGAALGSFLSGRNAPAANNDNTCTTAAAAGGRRRGRVDWLEVFAFALHGGLLNGPIGHYWFEWLETNGPKSKSKSMLIDQLCVQPPLLFVMFVFLDMTKAAVREVQPSCARTLSTIGPTIVSSWRFWPLAVWATFKYLKKKHYTVALNLCSIAWTVYLSKGKKQ